MPVPLKVRGMPQATNQSNCFEEQTLARSIGTGDGYQRRFCKPVNLRQSKPSEVPDSKAADAHVVTLSERSVRSILWPLRTLVNRTKLTRWALGIDRVPTWRARLSPAGIDDILFFVGGA